MVNVDAVTVDHVSKSYGMVRALDDVNVTIRSGEVFGLLGLNGAGKTTLIGLLSGLLKIETGRLSVLGVDVHQEPSRAKRLLGVVPQELSYDPFITLREALFFQSGYFGILRNQAWIDEIVQLLGLTNYVHKRFLVFSGGMKRRAMVALALVHRPPVVVLDEPTAGVDIDLRFRLWSLIHRLNKDGHTIFLVTHYLEEAQRLCHRVSFLHAGKLVYTDTMASVLARFGSICIRFQQQDPTKVIHALQDRIQHYGGLSNILVHNVEEQLRVLDLLTQSAVQYTHLHIGITELADVFFRVVRRVEEPPPGVGL